MMTFSLTADRSRMCSQIFAVTFSYDAPMCQKEVAADVETESCKKSV